MMLASSRGETLARGPEPSASPDVSVMYLDAPMMPPLFLCAPFDRRIHPRQPTPPLPPCHSKHDASRLTSSMIVAECTI